ncbi:MAG: YtxH domain-containing protein [Candidatus Acidiferrales bacterium]
MSRDDLSGTLTVFLIGVGVGAALGVLFAPKSGEETREFLRENARKGMDQATAAGRKLRRQARDVVEDVADQLGDVADAGSRAFGQVKKAIS